MPEKRMVRVPVGDVVATLINLVKEYKEMQPIAAGHGLRLPSTINYDFVDAAKDVAEMVSGLPQDHPLRKKIDVAAVNEGYQLLKSRKVFVWYDSKPGKGKYQTR